MWDRAVWEGGQRLTRSAETPPILSDLSVAHSLSLPLPLSLCSRYRLISYPADITERSEIVEHSSSSPHVSPCNTPVCISLTQICTSQPDTFLSLSSPLSVTHVHPTTSFCRTHVHTHTLQVTYVHENLLLMTGATFLGVVIEECGIRCMERWLSSTHGDLWEQMHEPIVLKCTQDTYREVPPCWLIDWGVTFHDG